MSVQKFIVNKESSHFTIIPNKVIQGLNNNLELLGFYLYLLSLPPNWIFQKTNLKETCNLGIKKIEKFFKLLSQSNLIHIVQTRDEKGRFSHFDLTVLNGDNFKINNLEELSTPQVKNRRTDNGATDLGSYKRNKEKIKNKEKKHKEPIKIPDWLNVVAWDEFKQHRKEIRKPMTLLAEKKLIDKLQKLKLEGNDPDEVINQSIMNGWTGVFELKSNNFNKNKHKDNIIKSKSDQEMRSTVKFWEKGNPDYDRINYGNNKNMPLNE